MPNHKRYPQEAVLLSQMELYFTFKVNELYDELHRKLEDLHIS